MNPQVQEMFLKAAFFFMVGVILASLFVWSMVQGLLAHLSQQANSFGNQDSTAFAYYFISWISGVAALALYWQAKNLFHYAEISK